MGPATPDKRDPHRLLPAVPAQYVPAINDIPIRIVVIFANFDCILRSGCYRGNNLECKTIDAHLLILKTDCKLITPPFPFLLPAVFIPTSRSHCCTLDPPSAHTQIFFSPFCSQYCFKSLLQILLSFISQKRKEKPTTFMPERS